MPREDGPGPAADPQHASILFSLPQELRDLIYGHIFSSTRFSYGRRLIDEETIAEIVPASHGLALLRTCRRTRNEIGSRWQSHVRFSFESTAEMLDKLAPLPRKTLRRIRHVRVRDDLTELSHPEGSRPQYFRLHTLLKLLPGLRLAELTVLGSYLDLNVYRNLDILIHSGSGWKTLRYISYSSSFLGYAPSMNLRCTPRKPQPAHWRGVLDERDGAASKPTVIIYRKHEPGHASSIFSAPCTRFWQPPPRDALEQAAFGRRPDFSLFRGEGRRKEVMVVVTRGAGVDIEEEPSLPLRQDGEADVRERFPGKTWEELRGVYGSIDEPEPGSKKTVQLVDSYVSVDDYAWTHHHAVWDNVNGF